MVSTTVSNKNFLKKFQFSSLTNWSARYLLENAFSYNAHFELVPIGDFLVRNKELIEIRDEIEYRRVTIKINNNGVLQRDTEKGENIGTKRQYIVREGQFIMSKIDARNGAFGLVPRELDGAIVTNDFPSFHVDDQRINTQFLVLITTTKEFVRFAQSCSSGTTNRQRINIDLFLQQRIPLPSLAEQERIVRTYGEKIELSLKQEAEAKVLEQEIDQFLCKSLGIKIQEVKDIQKGIHSISYSSINKWTLEDIHRKNMITSTKYKLVEINSVCTLITDGTHQTPKYFKEGAVFISAKNVTKEIIDWDDVKYVSQEAHELYNKHVKPQINDIFLAKNGTTGVAAILDEDKEFSIYVSLALLRPNTEVVHPNFLFRIINSKIARSQFFSRLIGIGVPNLHLGEIREVLIPLPPIQIQIQITNTIVDLKGQISKLKGLAAGNKKDAIVDFEKEIFQHD